MLVENKMPNSRQIGTLYLIPGVNQVDSDSWSRQLKNGYKRAVKALCDEGILSVIDESKINIGLVKKTYDVKVLEEWLQDAKGPLKGAIKKQLEVMQAEPEYKEAVG